MSGGTCPSTSPLGYGTATNNILFTYKLINTNNETAKCMFERCFNKKKHILHYIHDNGIESLTSSFRVPYKMMKISVENLRWTIFEIESLILENDSM